MAPRARGLVREPVLQSFRSLPYATVEQVRSGGVVSTDIVPHRRQLPTLISKIGFVQVVNESRSSCRSYCVNLAVLRDVRPVQCTEPYADRLAQASSWAEGYRKHRRICHGSAPLPPVRHTRRVGRSVRDGRGGHEVHPLSLDGLHELGSSMPPFYILDPN
jgi:hypothetical protein